MFDGLRRAIGAISVREEKGKIYVSGVPADVIARDIARIWNTSRVNSYMFTQLGRSGFSFHSFYAIEIYFVLEHLKSHPQAYTNQRALRRIQEELKSETWLRTLEDDASLNFNWDRLNEMSVSPKEHQREFLETYEKVVAKYQLKGYLLAAAPGTGKTISGLMLALINESDATVVICPKRAVIDVWVDTLKTRFKKAQRYWTSCDNTPVDQEANWVVFHYEALEQALSWLANNKKFKKITVILDECHNLNDPKSARTQNFMELCKDKNIQAVLWMSGTPIKALGNEAIPFLSTIDPRFTEKVRESFTKIFGKQVSRAVEILANRIGISSFRVNKADIVTNQVVETTKNVAFKGGEQFTLAVIKEEIRVFVEERFVYYKENERRFHNIYFEILAIYERSIRDESERKDYKLYRQYVAGLNKRFDPVADKDIVVWCNRFEERYICPKLSNSDRKEFRHVRSIYKYVSLKVRGEALGRILTKRRIACFVSMVPHCGLPDLIDSAEKKTLIFTSYVEVVKAAEAYLKKEGYQPLLVFGDTNKNLPMIMKQFKENPDLNPMIATYDSLSTAVPVIEANHCVLLNKPFRDHEYQQATSRINRLGQDSIVRITSMLLDTGQEPNLSTRSNEIMEWSRASVNAIMGMDGVDETITTEDNFVLEDGDDFTKVLLELVDEPYSPGSAAIHAPADAAVSMSKENYFFLF